MSKEEEDPVCRIIKQEWEYLKRLNKIMEEYPDMVREELSKPNVVYERWKRIKAKMKEEENE